MEKYEITQEDIEQIQTLKKIVKKIEETYQTLYQLDISNKKESIEYSTAIEKLSNYILLEEEHYKYCNLSFKKIEAWKNYILENNVSNQFNEFAIDSVINTDYKELVYKRIIQTLKYLKNQTKDAKDEYKNLGLLNPDDDAEKIVKSTSLLIDNIEIDTIRIYLNLIKNNSNLDKKDKILHIYNLCFINKNLEQELIENKFEIPNEVYITSKLIADANYLKTEDYDYIKDEYTTQNASIQILELLRIKNNQHKNIAYKNLLLFKELFLRANFAMTSDQELENFNYMYNSVLSDALTKDSNLSEDLITKCFLCIKKDKSRSLILSFKSK